MQEKIDSATSTVCSTPPPHDLYSIIIAEENRYKQKGYGLISASLMAISFYVFAPYVGEWSWPRLMDFVSENNYELWKVELFISWAFHLSCTIVTNLSMWLIYHLELPFFERYKINRDPWPWNKDRKEWNKLLVKSIGLVGFNCLVTIPCVLLMNAVINNYETQLSFEVEKLPDSWTIMTTISFMMICEDFAFHFTHKFMHWRVIYPYFHKVHHTYKTTVGIASEYTHPVDFFIGSLTPGALGAIILGKNCHFFTFLCWIMVRSGETIDGHCGYEFSWSPYRLVPFSASATYHDFHHSHNVGNFSSFFSFWDTICGTNKLYF